MRTVEDLKEAVQGAAYVVDPQAVADALLRRMLSDYARRQDAARRGGGA